MLKRQSDAARESILLLGDPRLRVVCRAVSDFESPEFKQQGLRLVSALERFREEHGFGRAIAAPQIGIPRRMIAMNLGNGPILIVNPELTQLSPERFSLWDDCMSFPWLMVRLQRHQRVDVSFTDENGKQHAWQRVNHAISELLQHEIDHLNGVLAIDHATDKDAIIARAVYLQQKQHFDRQVDYSISPTV